MATLTEETTTQTTDQSTAQTFKDRAIPMAKLSVPVIRLRPRSKVPLDSNWPDLATTDLEQILAWDKETPDANCGSVAKSDGFLFFESDEPGVVKRYQEETGASFQTYTAQSRPGRFHFYFRSTEKTRKVGSITQKELKFGSLRQHNAFVVSPGSIHPDSGKPYTVARNAPIIAAPDGFIEWLVAQKGEAKKEAAVQPGSKIIQGGRNTELTRMAGRLRRDGVEQEELEAILLRHNREYCDPPLAEKEVKTIAWSVARYDKVLGPTLTLGGVEPGVPVTPSAEQVEQQKTLQDLVDSTPSSQEVAASFADSLYPYWVYNGTLYEEFANLCGRGNLIPKEFFIEAAKAVIGAICGHRFSPQEARFYTFILTKIGGIGKGTAFDALRNLFAGTGLLYGLNQDGPGVFINIGCAEGNFSSSSGMHTNGFAKHNRILQIYDELTKLLEKFSIPGSGDSFLDDLNTLFEANAYIPSLTKASKIAVGVAGTQHQHNSILGGTTFDKWNSAFGKTTAEGSGFFQRLNIVSSDETETVAEIAPLDFNTGEGLELRKKFLAKIMPLEYQTVEFEKTPEAEKRFNEWHAAFKKEHHDEPAEVTGRLNVMVSRNYEHLAFMHAPIVAANPEKANEPIRIVCDLATMEKAIALAEYQYQVRAKHRPAQGANESALIEDSIRLTLLASERNSLSRSDLYKKSGSRKYGLLVFDRVLNALNNEGLVEMRAKSNTTTRGRKGEVVVWIGD